LLRYRVNNVQHVHIDAHTQQKHYASGTDLRPHYVGQRHKIVLQSDYIHSRLTGLYGGNEDLERYLQKPL